MRTLRNATDCVGARPVLPLDAMGRIWSNVRPERLKPGITVCRQGEPVRFVRLITLGAARDDLRNRQFGCRAIIRTPGWIIGAAAAVTRSTHEATVCTLTHCEVRTVSCVPFNEARKNDPVLAGYVQTILAADCVARRKARPDSVSRILDVLSDLFRAASMPRSDGSLRLLIDLSGTDLAELAGTSRERVSRVISQLAKGGVVHRDDRGWFVVPTASQLIPRICTSWDPLRHLPCAARGSPIDTRTEARLGGSNRPFHPSTDSYGGSR